MKVERTKYLTLALMIFTYTQGPPNKEGLLLAVQFFAAIFTP